MLFSTKESLDERIIRYLLVKGQTVKSIKRTLFEENVTLTLQGIYKTLRSLVDQEIIIKIGTVYSLSEEWRKKAFDMLCRTKSGFELAEGERISFDLASLVHLDLQWKNIILPLHEAYPGQPTFLYNTHEIWFYLNESRKESELKYFESFIKNKTFAFHAIGGSTIHDKMIKKELQSEFMQVSVGTEYFKKTDYPLIFGDYIITTRLSTRLAEEIEKCYANSTDIASLEAGLQKIGVEKKKAHLIIERDSEKAKKLRKKLSKDFFVPKELIDKFCLY